MTAPELDVTYETDPEKLSDLALQLITDVCDEDPHPLCDSLYAFTLTHPRKAAQLLMTLAALVPDTDTVDQLDNRMVRTAIQRQIPA